MIEIEGIEVLQYATLSYRWGGETNPTKLNAATYEQFRSRIPFQSLSKAIREAIVVCRGMSLRCLWVDVLCIVQGGGEDFAKEDSKMGSVYAGSVLTLAASDSIDAQSGCFRSRHPLAREQCPLIEPDTHWVLDSNMCHDYEKGASCFKHQNAIAESSFKTRAGFVRNISCHLERSISPKTKLYGNVESTFPVQGVLSTTGVTQIPNAVRL